MSIQAVAWVLDQEVKDPIAKLVLLSLANSMNGKTGNCFPSLKRLMQESSCARVTVIRKLQWLEENGWISKNCKFADDGRQLANSYTIHFGGINLKRGGINLIPEGISNDTGEGITVDTPYKKPEEIPEEYLLSEMHSDPKESLGETEKEKPQEKLATSKAKNKKPSYPEPFEQAWKLYPTDSNMSKKEAFTQWQRLDASDQALVVLAIPRFCEHCRANPDYRPLHFCRFISQRRFDGFQPQAQQQPKTDSTVLSFDDERWKKFLAFGRSRKEWQVSLWGPMPNSEGCLVPSHLILPSDGFDWAEKYMEVAQ